MIILSVWRNRTKIFKTLLICSVHSVIFQSKPTAHVLIEVAVNASSFVTVSRQFWNCASHHSRTYFSNVTMKSANSSRMMPQLRGWNSKWLVITVSSSLCLWCLALGAPIRPPPDPSKPSTELVDSVSEKDALVR